MQAPFRRRGLALALALTLVHLGQAWAEPTIESPDGPVPIGAFCDVTIRGMDLPESLVWEAWPPEPVRVTAAWGTTDPVLSLPTHRAREVALFVAWKDTAGGAIQRRIIPLVIGTPGPEPEPDPPGPDPPPTPTPGKRHVVIIHESAESTPAFAQMTTLLRQPPHADYLKAGGHKLTILDDDAVDADGNDAVAAWKPHLSGMTLPVLIIVDPAASTVVHKESLPATATAASVMEAVRKAGG